MPWALEAQRLLQDDWGVRADVWSVTSWTQLRREALAADDMEPPCTPTSRRGSPTSRAACTDTPGPVVAVSDWMRAVPDQIAPFVPDAWASLGTDGFGHSDTRAALRRPLRLDAPSIVLRALQQMVGLGECDRSVLGGTRNDETTSVDPPHGTTRADPASACASARRAPIPARRRAQPDPGRGGARLGGPRRTAPRTWPPSRTAAPTAPTRIWPTRSYGRGGCVTNTPAGAPIQRRRTARVRATPPDSRRCSVSSSPSATSLSGGTWRCAGAGPPPCGLVTAHRLGLRDHVSTGRAGPVQRARPRR